MKNQEDNAFEELFGNNQTVSYSESEGNLPRWLEDLSNNVRRNRPGSWKLSHGSTPDSASLHTSPTGEMQALINSFLIEDTLGEEVSAGPRHGSARHGRRSALAGTRSAGSSPCKTQDDLQSLHFPADMPSLEESWSSLSFFERKHKGRLSRKLQDESYSSSPELSVQRQSEAGVPEFDSHTDVADGKVEADFIIPELPSGKVLVLNITSTWGDRHYLGLNGIEVFGSTGELVSISKISADPADINVLPEYSKDPRVVSNLLDGVNRTHDDMHLWLTPFTPGTDHIISIVFQHTVSIAMIRIWNYNKSRIHSYRGARDVEISLDGEFIFRGEIKRACGGILGGTQAFGDTILFTTDEQILEMISRFDDSFSGLMNEMKTNIDVVVEDRPITAHNTDERPFTCAINSSSKGSEDISDMCAIFISGQKIELSLLGNWGHPTLIGLTGLELIGDAASPLPIEPHYLQCSVRSPDIYRLVDGENVTTDEKHMWCTPFTVSDTVLLTITFPLPVFLSTLRLWNYNGSPELSYCGVKLVGVRVDGKPAWEGCEVFTARRAPGNCHFNFAQDVALTGSTSHGDKAVVSRQPVADQEDYVAVVDEEEYEPPNMPQGFVFQLLVLSTWGDPYYVGLNGLEMYDDDGDRIPLSETNIGAYPDSVNILEGVDDDVRTPDKLIDGVNDTFDGQHMWLAPILPNQLNRVYIVFDYPVTISMIKLWNYSKTPSRGVKEFEILVDDLLVYNGVLDKVSRSCEHGNKVSYRTVLFTRDMNLLRQERNTQVRHSSYCHNVHLLNNQQRVTSGGSCISADQSLRPLTSLIQPTRSKSMHNM